VFLAFDDNKVMTLSRRLTIEPNISAMLGWAVECALTIVEADVKRRNEDVVLALDNAILADSTLIAELQAQASPLSHFLDDEASAVEILKGPRVGGRRGTSRHHTVAV